nr:site-specific integrase [uncultured Pseudodesulfovibrio sp.]
MPRKERFKTGYPGVWYVEGANKVNGKPEKIYYIIYRKDGNTVEEKAGRQKRDDMTPARASMIRSMRIDGDQQSNKERREKEEAERKEREERPTITRLWKEYEAQKTNYKGRLPDKSRYKKYLKPEFGNKVPADIITLDVDRLRLRLLKKDKKSPQTVKLILSLLKRLINFGVKKGLCSMPDPSKLSIEIPLVDNVKTEDLSADQLKALLKAIDEDSNIDVARMMKLALFTGMRRGEIFRLKWKDLDFDRGFILLDDPKGGVSQKIPMMAAARELLESHNQTKSPYVFPGQNGGQRKDVRTPVNRIKERAGLPKDFRPLHGLRHAYASMLASSGKVDMYTLQKLLTHKSPQMTQRYAHLHDEALKKAANVAEDIITDAMQDDESKRKVVLFPNK